MSKSKTALRSLTDEAWRTASAAFPGAPPSFETVHEFNRTEDIDAFVWTVDNVDNGADLASLTPEAQDHAAGVIALRTGADPNCFVQGQSRIEAIRLGRGMRLDMTWLIKNGAIEQQLLLGLATRKGDLANFMSTGLAFYSPAGGTQLRVITANGATSKANYQTVRQVGEMPTGTWTTYSIRLDADTATVGVVNVKAWVDEIQVVESRITDWPWESELCASIVLGGDTQEIDLDYVRVEQSRQAFVAGSGATAISGGDVGTGSKPGGDVDDEDRPGGIPPLIP